MLFIIRPSPNHEGFNVDAVSTRAEWEEWCKDNIDDTRPACRPKFRAKAPATLSEWHGMSYPEALVVRGEVVQPKPVEVVTEYELPDGALF